MGLSSKKKKKKKQKRLQLKKLPRELASLIENRNNDWNRADELWKPSEEKPLDISREASRVAASNRYSDSAAEYKRKIEAYCADESHGISMEQIEHLLDTV